MPLASGIEANLLDSASLFGSTRYLRLLCWTGTTPSDGAGITLNEDGSLPANVAEASWGGYAARLTVSTEWNAAVAGAPTLKQWPSAATGDVTFTASSGSGDVCAYAWTTSNAAFGVTQVISFGVMLDSNGAAAVVHVDSTHPLTFNSVTPIIERLGDPPPSVDPT